MNNVVERSTVVDGVFTSYSLVTKDQLKLMNDVLGGIDLSNLGELMGITDRVMGLALDKRYHFLYSLMGMYYYPDEIMDKDQELISKIDEILDLISISGPGSCSDEYISGLKEERNRLDRVDGCVDKEVVKNVERFLAQKCFNDFRYVLDSMLEGDERDLRLLEKTLGIRLVVGEV